MSNVLSAIESELKSIEQRTAELVQKQSGQLSQQDLIKISALATESGQKHALVAQADQRKADARIAVRQLEQELREARRELDKIDGEVDAAKRRLRKIDPQLITLRAKQASLAQSRGLTMAENNELIQLRSRQALLLQSKQTLSMHQGF